MNLNKVFIIGRLTHDPETRSTSTGQNVTTLKMATNRVWNDQSSGQRKEATEYHTIIAWSKLGDIASRYLKRGGLVMIEGRMQTRNWVGQDNVKRYTTEIVAEGLQLGPRTDGGGGGSSNYIRASSPTDQGNDMSDVRRNTLTPPVPTEENIPIIDANEPTNSSSSNFEEDEMKITEKDLPF